MNFRTHNLLGFYLCVSLSTCSVYSNASNNQYMCSLSWYCDVCYLACAAASRHVKCFTFVMVFYTWRLVWEACDLTDAGWYLPLKKEEEEEEREGENGCRKEQWEKEWELIGLEGEQRRYGDTMSWERESIRGREGVWSQSECSLHCCALELQLWTLSGTWKRKESKGEKGQRVEEKHYRAS